MQVYKRCILLNHLFIQIEINKRFFISELNQLPINQVVFQITFNKRFNLTIIQFSIEKENFVTLLYRNLLLKFFFFHCRSTAEVTYCSMSN